MPGSGDAGAPLKLIASRGDRFELLGLAESAAPSRLYARRSGKDLRIHVDGRSEPDLIIERYFEEGIVDAVEFSGRGANGQLSHYVIDQWWSQPFVDSLGVELQPIILSPDRALLTPLGLAAVAGGSLLLGQLFKAGSGGVGAPLVALAPASDTGASSADRMTSDNRPVLRGLSAVPGHTITVLADDGKTVLARTVVASDGSWSVQPNAALPEGSHNLSVTATDPAGNQSPSSPLPLVIDTVAPSAPAADVAAASDTGRSNTDNLTSDNTPTISGAGAKPGDLIKVKRPDGSVLGTANVSADGTWSVTPTVPLTDGVYNLTVTATDPAGNESAPTTVPVTIDTLAPAAPPADVAAASDTGPSNTDNITSDNTPTISGAGAVPGDTITVKRPDGSLLGTTTVAADGTWSITPTLALPDGVYDLKVTATDAAGNESAPTSVPLTIDTVRPNAPLALLDPSSATGVPLDNVTADNTPTISGVGATPGDTMTLRRADGTVLGTAVVGANGAWSITPAVAQPDGLNLFRLTTTDPAGNESAPTTLPVTIRSTAPAAPAASLDPASNTGFTTDNVTADNTPTIRGSGATPGDTISLYAPDGVTVLGTARVATDGSWSITPSSPLSDGLQNLSVKASDPAGNISAPTAVPVVIDTAVAAPVISPTNGFTVSGTGEPGATVMLRDSSNNLIGATVVAPDGSWRITPVVPLADGTALVASQTDVAGNSNSPGAATVDLGLPLIKPTNGTVIYGTGKPGAQVELTLPDGTPILDSNGQPLTAAVDANGNWSATPGTPLPDGTVIKARDLASGLSSTEAVDATPPSVPTIDLTAASDTGASSTDNLTRDTTPTLAGTGTPGSIIQIYDGATLVGAATVGADGRWSSTLPATSPGVHN